MSHDLEYWPPIPRNLTEGRKRFRWTGNGRRFHDYMAGRAISYRELVEIVGKEFAAELLKREQARRQPPVIWKRRDASRVLPGLRTKRVDGGARFR